MRKRHRVPHRNLTFLALVILTWSVFAMPAGAQISRRVEEIDRLRAKTDQDIAKSEAEPEYSNIYLTELAVNKNDGPYPAVGIYRPVVKFYYTFGDREKDPYPNRLLKIVVVIDRSNRKEQAEFVFDQREQLIFHLEKKDEIERRAYFAAGRPLRLLQNGRTESLKSRAQKQIVAAILKQHAGLVGIFRRSLAF
jgi:hypothetical protein